MVMTDRGKKSDAVIGQKKQEREHSSVGLEHLPYKQRVGGSTPSAPTTKEIRFTDLFFFVYIHIHCNNSKI